MKRRTGFGGAALALLALVLAGCASHPPSHHRSGTGTAAHGGGYYQNDGPPRDTDVDWSKIPNAVPKNVPPSKHGNPTSYTALGKRYYVLKSAAGFTQTGMASWYGRQFAGQRTASGAPYNMFAMTAAHKRLPIPTWVRVTNLQNHKQVIVKINDRGPFLQNRIIDLSYAAAHRLGMVGEGSAPVRIRTVTPASLKQSGQGGPNHHGAPAVPLRSAANNAASEKMAAAAHHRSAPKSAGDSGGQLQIGAFSSAAHAARARARARAAGVGPVVVMPPGPDIKLYRVRVGPFHSLSAQRNARQQLADAGFPVRAVSR